MSRTDIIKWNLACFMLCSNTLNFSQCTPQVLFKNKNTVRIPTRRSILFKRLFSALRPSVFIERYRFLEVFQFGLSLVNVGRKSSNVSFCAQTSGYGAPRLLANLYTPRLISSTLPSRRREMSLDLQEKTHHHRQKRMLLICL